MSDEEKKELIKKLYAKNGIEVDIVDEIEFKVIEEYATKAVIVYRKYLQS